MPIDDKESASGYVYLHQVQGKGYKVGITNDPRRRLAQYKTENPFIEEVDSFLCMTYREAEAAEKEILIETRHLQLDGQSREWLRHDSAILESWNRLVNKYACLPASAWEKRKASLAGQLEKENERLREKLENAQQLLESRDQELKYDQAMVARLLEEKTAAEQRALRNAGECDTLRKKVSEYDNDRGIGLQQQRDLQVRIRGLESQLAAAQRIETDSVAAAALKWQKAVWAARIQLLTHCFDWIPQWVRMPAGRLALGFALLFGFYASGIVMYGMAVGDGQQSQQLAKAEQDLESLREKYEVPAVVAVRIPDGRFRLDSGRNVRISQGRFLNPVDDSTIPNGAAKALGREMVRITPKYEPL